MVTALSLDTLKPNNFTPADIATIAGCLTTTDLEEDDEGLGKRILEVIDRGALDTRKGGTRRGGTFPERGPVEAFGMELREQLQTLVSDPSETSLKNLVETYEFRRNN